jgi:protein-S-isoprenylcysteine O-methyltransferase Ste14
MKWLELKIPPPIVALVFALLMSLGANAAPTLSIPLPRRDALALGLALLGFGIDAVAVVSFWRARTTINPLNPGSAQSLVTSGIYRLTRNPMYLGLTLVLTAWGLHLANALALGLVAGFACYLARYQIRPEERILREKFGPGYDAYTRRVRRWI